MVMTQPRPARIRRVLPLALLLPTAALISAGPAAASEGGGSGDPHPSAKPTVVLVHGAWADASGWSGVTESLQAKGYPVVATANPLRSLTGDSAYLAARLKTIKGPIVLVGHSYGGAVITNAATGNPNVKSLVYIAAFAPDRGEATLQLAAKYPGSRLTDDPAAPIPTALDAVPLGGGPTDVDLYVKPDKFGDVFLSDRLDASRANVLAASQRPATAVTGAEKSGTPAWKTIPSWYLVATDDRTIGTENLRFMAEQSKLHHRRGGRPARRHGNEPRRHHRPDPPGRPRHPPGPRPHRNLPADAGTRFYTALLALTGGTALVLGSRRSRA